MCGRYVLRKKPDPSEDDSWESYWNNIQLSEPRYNIGPHPIKGAPVLINSGVHGLAAQNMLFGMQPRWAKSPLINAKAEGLKQSKFWKPLAAMRPCLIPADGFYEPQGPSNIEGKRVKRPWYGFELDDQQAFLMAGMWKPMGDESRYVILTREPNSCVAPIHHRMPVLFTRNQCEHANDWLNTELNFDTRLAAVAETLNHDNMISFPVSDQAKNMGNDGPNLFKPQEALF